MIEVLRTLAARRWTAVWVVASVALGLGSVASVFSVADRLLVRPPAGVRDPGSVRRVVARALDPRSGAQFEQATFSYPVYAASADALRPAVELAAYTEPEQQELLFGAADVPVRVSLAAPNYFELLGVHPAAGTLFRAADPATSSGPLVVLSERLARRLSHRPRALVGRSVVIGQNSVTVVGVAEPGFAGMEVVAADAWLPLEWGGGNTLGSRWMADAQVYPLSLLARFGPSASPSAAAPRVRAALQSGAGEGESGLRYLGAELVPLTAAGSARAAGESRLTVWLAVTALAIVLVAALNIGALNLASALGRSRDFAVRMALGATRARIIRLLVGEAVILTALGAIAGMAIGLWGSATLANLILPRASWAADTLLSGRIVGATLLTAAVVGLGSSLAPALRTAAVDPSTCVRDAPAAERSGGRGWRFALHAVQACGAAGVLLGAGLFVHSAYVARTLPLGFDPRRLYVVSVRVPPGTEPSPRVVEAYHQLGERLRRTPGVVAVAASSAAPMVNTVATLLVTEQGVVEGSGPSPMDGPFLTRYSGDYFGATGTRLVTGRIPADSSVNEAVVSRATAAQLWPSRNPIGRCVHLYSPAEPCRLVVGVVDDVVRFSISDRPALQVYAPCGAGCTPESLLLVVRGDPRHGVSGTALHRMLADAFPTGVSVRVRSVDEVVSEQSAVWRNGEKLFLLLSALMTLLTALGIYGSLMGWAKSREYEFGVRLALGATPRAIAAAFLRFGVGVTLLGLAAAVAVVHAFRGLIEPVLFRTSVL
jgi:putative ABC transport system permease protein